MGDGFACCSSSSSSSSSSMKLLLFMLPLIVVAVFVSVHGPNISSSTFVPNHPWSWSSFPSLSSNNNNNTGSVEESDQNELVDLHSRVVMVDAQNKKEALLYDESLLNRSSSPLIPVESLQVQQLNGTILEDEDLAVSADGKVQSDAHDFFAATMNNESVTVNGEVQSDEFFFVSMNESDSTLPMKPKAPKSLTKLQRMEAGLQRARLAIKEAATGNQTLDPDFVPNGPMYLNSKAFHRSYLEMEKKFKIFVYEEGEQPVFHDGPCRSIYSTEGNFIYTLDVNRQFRTKNPEKAHAFFFPFSVARMVRFVYVRDSHDFGPIKRTVVDYVNLISGRYPYWNRSMGADHFMLACHDWGPETSFSHPLLGKNSIHALCNANTSERFSPIKDVSIPEINLRTGDIKGLIGGPSPSHRSLLAFFAGGVHGPIRPVLLEHWENKDEDMKVFKYLPKGVSYYDMMRKAKFCLCPSGYEVASPRTVEAIYNGCVPVLISEHYVPPFSDVLNWKSFSVEVSTKDIPNLKNILLSISTRQYIRKQRRVLQVRRHFEFNSPPKRFDVFHMILHSIWLRRLNVRIHDEQSGVTSR
ncbi:hypothetical protein Ddye_008047 [Dipteronia dyeriana]|uniref:Exostosin GT47 domain-containing protein n=1 Tax=Dipteronia dyeriana TaxID=168575 RepID=A0AAD9X922_9ROSI|nr:hypothetical protein Ddye_008047 [Dipteronia dyeriana]